MPSYTLPKLSDAQEQAAREAEATRMGTDQACHSGIASLRSIVPFDQYAISGIEYQGLGVGSGTVLASDMPEAFLRAYVSKGFYRLDPMASRSTPRQNWASWHDLTPDEINHPDHLPIRQLERAHGVGPRSFVGFYRGDFRYGGGIFTRATPFTSTEKFVLEAGVRMVHAELSARRLAHMTAHAGLSQGEISCLKTAADGLSAEEASNATGYTAETIASYIKAATKKLGCVNRTHAAAEAIRRRLFD